MATVPESKDEEVHDVGGMSQKDFDLATVIDDLLEPL